MAEASPLVPRIVGRYALYGKIASGGMATVHVGRLLGAVGFARTVAVKRLHPHFAEDPEFVSMFLDEARLVARINHPNVVPTIDVVSTGGELYIVMEYVRGESLARLIRSANQSASVIPASMIATIVVGVLQGLHAAHEAKTERGEPLGIVHRDVSPHNILVGVDGVPRVLDFGVAKALGRLQTTREGQLKGKLAYMAPEQIQGETSRATDIYATSIVLWEALTGRRLFAGENEGQVLDRVRKGSQVPPTEYVPGLPRALDEVTLRGLAFDPKDRFATAKEMARALEDALPLVSASKIGEWVEASAKTTLDLQSEQIAAIESSSSTQAPASVGALRTETRLRPSSADQEPVEAAPLSIPTQTQIPIIAEEFTQLSSGSVSAARLGPPSWMKSRTRLVVGGLLGVGLAFVAFFFTRATPTEPRVAAPSASDSSSTDPKPPTSVAVDTPPASASAMPSAIASGVPTPSSLPTASGVPTLRASLPATSPAVRSPSPRRPTPAADPCNPPYFFDSRGIRVFKKECL